MAYPKNSPGFTLIELSIVLVIIGLIVGGILVGQDLIKSAETRAQISQIEKLNTAVNTFRGKFLSLPGDMALGSANQFGFAPGGSCAGTSAQRDGNGMLDGDVSLNSFTQTKGETALFWQDLSSAPGGNLIEGTFPNSGAPLPSCAGTVDLSTTAGTSFVGDYFPAAKIGHGDYIYVAEGNGYNWFGLSQVTSVTSGAMTSNPNVSVIQAYNMDKKTDDGIPNQGHVVAFYVSSASAFSQSPHPGADSLTSCYNTSGGYSISSLANYGGNGNCGMAFRFH